MKNIVFATHNSYKLVELRSMIPHLKLWGLDDIECHTEIEESADSLEGNALIKARFVVERYGMDCFADDTGLEVAALDGAPGVYSARYAGIPTDNERNIDKLLADMMEISDRKAQFRTVIALLYDEKEWLFEGVVKGEILYERRGEKGFGYDAIFMPTGYDKSFAEMNTEEKNAISHRGKAVEKLLNFLNKID